MQQSISFREIYRRKRLTYYQWRSQATLTAKLALAGSLAALTGLLAQVKIFLPWTPVPIVASQLGVILAAVLLGKRWGALSMLMYALGGLAGIPWFAGFKGGLAALAGPTGGYVLGFILAALFLGNLFDTKVESRRCYRLPGYTLRSAHPGLYSGNNPFDLMANFSQWTEVSFSSVLWLGYLPFIIGDILKSLVGAGIAKTIMPMEKY